MVFRPKKVVKKSPTRAEMIARGNLARRESIQRRDVVTQQAIEMSRQQAEKERYERELAEYNKAMAEFEREQRKAEQQAEEDTRQQQLAYWRANKERQAFVQYGSEVPHPVTQRDVQDLGLTSEGATKIAQQKAYLLQQQKQLEMNRASIQPIYQQQYQRIQQQYGQAKADAGASKMGYSVQKPAFVAPGTSELKRLPGENVEQSLIRQGMDPQDAKKWLSQLEADKSGSSYKVIQHNVPGGEKKFDFKNVTGEREAYDLAIMRDKYNQMSGFQKSAIQVTTLGSSKYGKEYVTSKIPYGLFGAEGSSQVKTKDVVAKEMLFLSNLQRNKPNMNIATKYAVADRKSVV